MEIAADAVTSAVAKKASNEEVEALEMQALSTKAKYMKALDGDGTAKGIGWKRNGQLNGKVANWRDGALISGFAVEDHLTYFISTTCSGHSWQFEQGSAVIRDSSSKNAHYDVYNAAMAYLMLALYAKLLWPVGLCADGKVANWRDGALISGSGADDHLSHFISTTYTEHSWQFEQGSAVIRDGSSKNAHFDVYNAAMAYLERNNCSMVSTLGNRRGEYATVVMFAVSTMVIQLVLTPPATTAIYCCPVSAVSSRWQPSQSMMSYDVSGGTKEAKHKAQRAQAYTNCVDTVEGRREGSREHALAMIQMLRNKHHSEFSHLPAPGM
eukprot:15244-Heterococcus_DN1.PRE.1